MSKELRGRAFVMIDGEWKELDQLPESLRHEIADNINDVSMKAIGYVRSTSTEEICG